MKKNRVQRPFLKRHSEANNKKAKPTVTHKDKKQYTSKRIKCNLCDKKFNKRDTFDKHLKTTHGENENSNEKSHISSNIQIISSSNSQVIDDLPSSTTEVQPRVTRSRHKKMDPSPWNPNN